MTEWLRAHPIIWLLAPLIAGIMCCCHTGWPRDLMANTEFPYLDSMMVYRTVVTDYPYPRAKTTRVTASMQLPASGQKATTRTVYLYLSPDSTQSMPQPGDVLLVRTAIRRGGMLGKFDYGQWLRMQDIVGAGMVRRGQWRVISHQPLPWWKQPRIWQHHLAMRLRRWLPEGEELGTIEALTLGYKEDLDPTRKKQFQASGAAHVLAVSGLHTLLIYNLLLWIFTLGERRRPLYEEQGKQWALSGVIVFVMWGYAAITGMSPSVVRSVIMLTLGETATCLHRPKWSIYQVMLAAWIILMIWPKDLYSVSFQLSFAAVTAILLLSDLVGIYLPRLPHTGYIRGLIIASIAAQIGTLPLGMYYFGQISNYFLLTNIVILPVATATIASSIALLAVGSVPVLGMCVAKISYGCAWIMNHYVGWIEQLPGACSHINCSMPMVGCLYGAIVSGYLGLKHSLWWLLATGGCLVVFCYLYTTL